MHIMHHMAPNETTPTRQQDSEEHDESGILMCMEQFPSAAEHFRLCKVIVVVYIFTTVNVVELKMSDYKTQIPYLETNMAPNEG